MNVSELDWGRGSLSHLFLCYLIACSFSALGSASPSPGSLDTTFELREPLDGTIRVVALAGDGKVLIGGTFTHVGARARQGIARLNPSGTLDLSFEPANPPLINGVNAMALQADGRILIADSPQWFREEIQQSRILRLSLDGSLDPAFGNGIAVSGVILSLAVAPNGSALVGGAFTSVDGQPHKDLMRLNPDGQIDHSFTSTFQSADPRQQPTYVRTVALDASDNILVAGYWLKINGSPHGTVARLRSDGNVDASFNPPPTLFTSSSGEAQNIAGVWPLRDGRILVPTSVSSLSLGRLVRLDSGGQEDLTFEAELPMDPFLRTAVTVNSLLEQNDGRLILLGPYWTWSEGNAPTFFGRLDPDGLRDATFESAAITREQPWSENYGLAFVDDAQVMVGGPFTSVGQEARHGIMRFNCGNVPPAPPQVSTQPLDLTILEGQSAALSVKAASFVPPRYQWKKDGVLLPGATNRSVKIAKAQPDHMGVYVVEISNPAGSTTSAPAMLTVNPPPSSPGCLDRGFDLGNGPNRPVLSLAVQRDGQILVGGEFTQIDGIARPGLARLTPDGQVDPSFAPTGSGSRRIVSMNLQPNGQILVAGNVTDWSGASVARLNPDGTVDPTFRPPSDTAGFVLLQSDGKIITIGSGTSIFELHVRRLNPDGSVDPAFDSWVADVPPFVGYTVQVLTAALDREGHLLIGGRFSRVMDKPALDLARLNANGSWDSSFRAANLPRCTVYDSISSLLIAGDGKILAVGTQHVLRFGPDGILEGATELASGPFCPKGQVLLAQPDGKVILGGQFGRVQGVPRSGIARLNIDGSLDPSFDPGSGVQEPDVKACALQPDGKVIVGGSFKAIDGISRQNLARLFGGELPGLPRINRQPAGATVVVGQTTALSVQASSAAAIFYQWHVQGNPLPGATNSVLLLPDIQLWQSGDYFVVLSNSFGKITSSNATVHVVTSNDPVVLRQPTNQSVEAGQDVVLSIEATNLLTLSYQWQRAGTRIPGATNSVLTLHNAQPADNGIYTVVISTPFRSVISSAAVVVVNPPQLVPGALDVSFYPRYAAKGYVSALAVQEDGRIVVGGQFSEHTGPAPNHLARLHPDGTIDESFVCLGVSGGMRLVGSGEPVDDTAVNAVVIDGQKRIVVGGSFASAGGSPHTQIARFHPDGSVDGNFAPLFGGRSTSATYSPTVRSLALQLDGKLLVGGEFNLVNGATWPCLVRLLPDGTVDNSFAGFSGASGAKPALLDVSRVNAILLQQNGQILIGGLFTNVNGAVRQSIARLSANGELDSSFLPPSFAPTPMVNAMALGLDGGIYLAGSEPQTGPPFGPPYSRPWVVRLHSNGNFDSSFTPVSLESPSYVSNVGPVYAAAVLSLALDKRGGVLLGGNFTSVDNRGLNRICRLNSDGSHDLTFNPGTGSQHSANSTNEPSWVSSILVDPQGGALIGGSFTVFQSSSRTNLARVLTSLPEITLLSPIRTATAFSTFVRSVTGWRYSLEFKDTTTGDTWFSLPPLQGDGRVIRMDDTNCPSSQRFYRVRMN